MWIWMPEVHTRELERDPPLDMAVLGDGSRAVGPNQQVASAIQGELSAVEQFLADVEAGTWRMVASVQELTLG